MAILLAIKLLKFLKIMAVILENLHWKSVYDCWTPFRKSLFIRVSKNAKVNNYITNVSNVNTYVFTNSLLNKEKLATS